MRDRGFDSLWKAKPCQRGDYEGSQLGSSVKDRHDGRVGRSSSARMISGTRVGVCSDLRAGAVEYAQYRYTASVCRWMSKTEADMCRDIYCKVESSVVVLDFGVVA